LQSFLTPCGIITRYLSFLSKDTYAASWGILLLQYSNVERTGFLKHLDESLQMAIQKQIEAVTQQRIFDQRLTLATECLKKLDQSIHNGNQRSSGALAR